MRRKQTVFEDAVREAGISVTSLRPCPADDLAAPYKERRRVFRRWLRERSEWVARREEYAETHGWPGGALARFEEENAAHPIDSAPFDPAWEVAHGHL